MKSAVQALETAAGMASNGWKPYPAYKESGMPWLGRVPDTWDLRRTKTLLRERVQKGFPNEPMLAATQTKGVVRKEQYENRTVLALKDFHLLKLVRRGDFVISLRSFQGGIEYAREQGIISPAYTVLYPLHASHHGYLAKLFKSKPYIENLTLHVTGIRQGQNVDYTQLARAPIPLPPPGEQDAIVRFLDYHDRLIRKYIRAKQKLIALLTEQKQAIIQHAVTRGLPSTSSGQGSPDVKLKPSGVDWLGEIPEHWEVVRLRTLLTRIDQGVSPQAEARLANEESWGVLKSGCVNRGVFRDSEHKRLPAGFPVDIPLAVAPGDVLVSRACGSPSLVGSVGQVKSLRYRLILSDKTFRLVFSDARIREYCVFAMNTRLWRNQVEQAISGAEGLANNLPLSELKDFRLALPPSEEAQAIAERLSTQVAGLDPAISRAQHQIALMREYRTRLTADVVTGKMDVRDAAAALPAEMPDVEPEEQSRDADDGELISDEEGGE